MKRSGDSEKEKRRKRRRLLQQLGDQRIPSLGPADPGFQQLWETSYSGLVLRRSCSLPAELHGRVQAALLTLRRRGCLLRDLVRVRDRDVFTAVSRALFGQPGHTYRYLDTRLFAIPWHSEDQAGAGGGGAEGVSEVCCDADLRAACKALWELNCFFCADVGLRKEDDAFAACRRDAADAADAKLSEEEDKEESRLSDESKNSEGGGDSESKHSEEWDVESRHSEEGCCSEPPRPDAADWDAESKHSDEGVDPQAAKQGAAPAGGKGSKAQGEGRCAAATAPPGDGAEPCCHEKPVAELKQSLSGYHIEDKEDEQGCSRPSPAQAAAAAAVTPPGPAQFNVTLLNYMDPAAMSQLKEEPYYGMGKMAVGWHHDENLVSRSPVAVYSYNCHGDKGVSPEEGGVEKACWRIGLKVAWDIHTPGLTLPLQSGDCYYMRDGLNRSHQHCVLAGDTPRFSSTHRVAECSTGTLDYIQSRSRHALANLQTGAEPGAPRLASLLPSTLQHCEEVHNEVEFEWLRQYWFQGRRYARFCSWWSRPMEQLETDWRHMELMTKLFLAAVEDEGRGEEGRREMAEALLSALTDRQQHRQTWRDRCHSSLAQSLPPEEAPEDRPFWGPGPAHPTMPLPFDLADIISRVESLLWRM